MTFNQPTPGFSLGIDGASNTSPRRWNHDISDVRVYQRTLTAAELTALARPIIPAAATLTLIGATPMVGVGFSPIPASASLTLIGAAPQLLVAQAPIYLSPDAATLALTGAIPQRVRTTRDPTFQPIIGRRGKNADARYHGTRPPMTIMHDPWELYIGDTWRLTFNLQDADGSILPLTDAGDIIWKLADAGNTHNWFTVSLKAGGVTIVDDLAGQCRVNVVPDKTLKLVPDGPYIDELTLINDDGIFTMCVGPITVRAKLK